MNSTDPSHVPKILLNLLGYIVSGFLFYRIGKKFQIGSILKFYTPIYRLCLLYDCARLSRWFVFYLLLDQLFLFFSMIVTLITLNISYNISALSLLIPYLNYGPYAVFISLIASACLFGHIAKRLGKNGVLWGIVSFFSPLLLHLPLLILAFDKSRPVVESTDSAPL